MKQSPISITRRRIYRERKKGRRGMLMNNFKQPYSASASTTTTQFAKLQLGNNCSPTTTTTTTDSDTLCRVTFSDPCSMCGTKKRHLSSFHQYQSFQPLKKQQTTTITTPSLSPYPSPTPTSPSSSSSSCFRRCNSAPLPSFHYYNNNVINTTTSPENVVVPSSSPSPSPSPQHGSSSSPFLGHSVSFSGSSSQGGRSLEASPTTASRPPRPPPPTKFQRSVSDLTSSEKKRFLFLENSSPKKASSGGCRVHFPANCTDSETRMEEESPAENKRKRLLKARLAEVFSEAISKIMQEHDKQEEEEEEEDRFSRKDEVEIVNNSSNNNKEVFEITDEENVETERDENTCRGSLKCSCGKTIQFEISMLPE